MAANANRCGHFAHVGADKNNGPPWGPLNSNPAVPTAEDQASRGLPCEALSSPALPGVVWESSRGFPKVQTTASRSLRGSAITSSNVSSSGCWLTRQQRLDVLPATSCRHVLDRVRLPLGGPLPAIGCHSLPTNFGSPGSQRRPRQCAPDRRGAASVSWDRRFVSPFRAIPSG